MNKTRLTLLLVVGFGLFANQALAESGEPSKSEKVAAFQLEKIQLEKEMDDIRAKIASIDVMFSENKDYEISLVNRANKLVDEMKTAFEKWGQYEIHSNRNYHALSFRSTQKDCPTSVKAKFAKNKKSEARLERVLYNPPVDTIIEDSYFMCGYFSPKKMNNEEYFKFLTEISEEQKEMILELSWLDMALNNFEYFKPHRIVSESAFRLQLSEVQRNLNWVEKSLHRLSK